MNERSHPGTYAYFFAEPEQPGPVFFENLPPESFSAARPKSSHRAEATDRMVVQLQVGGYSDVIGGLTVKSCTYDPIA